MSKYIKKIAFWLLKHVDEKDRVDVLRESVKHLFCTVSSDDILKEDVDGSITFEGKKMDASYRQELRGQAELLNKMLLWRVLKKDVEYALRRKMFEEARVELDVVWGQLATWLYDVIKTRVDKLRR